MERSEAKMSTYFCALLLCLAVSTFALTDLNLACSTDEDCIANSACHFNYSNTLCEEGGCFCDTGYVANGQVCAERKEVGDSCQNDAECQVTIKGSICSKGLNRECECHPYNGTLVTTVDGIDYCHTGRFDDDCDHIGECLASYFGNSVCKRPEGCECAEGYHEIGYKCVIGSNGDNCTNDTHCDADKNLECIDDQCACSNNFNWDRAHDTCIHDDAIEVGEGDDCVPTYGDGHEYCPHTHECKTCPGKINEICLIPGSYNIDGASAVTITSTLMVMIGSLYAILV